VSFTDPGTEVVAAHKLLTFLISGDGIAEHTEHVQVPGREDVLSDQVGGQCSRSFESDQSCSSKVTTLGDSPFEIRWL
jgi:hypothetical protein